MNNICRLCLTVSTEISLKLCEETEILNKVWSCLSIKVSIKEEFPNKLCKSCVQKIEETFNYYEVVKENQYKLENLLNLGKNVLQDFYTSLNTNDVKLEKCNEDNNATLKLEDHFSSDDETALSILKRDNEEIISRTSNIPLLKEQSLNCKNEVFEGSFNLTESNDTMEKIKNAKDNRGKRKYNKNILNMESVPNLNTDFLITKSECLTCFHKFENQADLLHHYIKEHLNKELNETDQNKSEKEYVIKCNENGRNFYVCIICDKMYEKKKDILRHLHGHKDKRPFVCKICGSTYKNVYEIIRHGRVHYGEKLHCSYQCGFSTVYTGALRDHEKRHSKTSKYICKDCGKGFQVKTWFEQHQNVHSGEKPYTCDICGVAFHMHRYLTSHLSKVHPQSSDVKRYVCVHCSLPCDSRNSLKKHMEVHGIKTDFLCDLCGKVYPNVEQLKYHKNVHLGVKPFACSTCNKQFSRKFHLKIHEQTHTGERKHACLKCSKNFTQRSTLLRHIRRHHPENETRLGIGIN
ncbi:hypothetical protein K1T71_013365 [Dendrolimus kikuchii]|uniref:Uncharacterized protein n=1 Tax=Dendrolimus kikuchii TaxID=765133 RepID=A0ACC1CHX2_9NEOP|nr:hypothetical protein K1T71_013365 [Dendrolimus kikuchii]